MGERFPIGSPRQMRPVFSMGLNQRDKPLLVRINNFFNEIGSVYTSDSNNSSLASQEDLRIFKLSNFNSFINHFSIYPLTGFKLYNFTIWCKIVKLLENNALGSTPETIDKINDLKSKLNK